MPKDFDSLIVRPRTNQRGNKFYGKLFCPQCRESKVIWVRSKKAYRRGDYNNKLCQRCSAIKNLGNYAIGVYGENNPAWRGGRKISDGYIRITLMPSDPFYSMTSRDHSVAEHRLLIAQKLGRCLLYTEVVHHINGIKDDNRLCNLALLEAKEHLVPTLIQEMIPRLQQRIIAVEEENRELRLRVRQVEGKIGEIYAQGL